MLVIFDEVCGLCQRSVTHIARADRQRTFRFATFDSGVAREALAAAGWTSREMRSVLLVDEEGVWTKSDAVLRIVRRLGCPLRLVSWLRVVPRGVRDAVYDVVARHRYAWFGKTTACARLPADVRDRVVGS